jgi:hypothetical protein
MPDTTEQEEFNKIDSFLDEAITKYSFELNRYGIVDRYPWSASIQYYLCDDSIQVLGVGLTRLEALFDLNTQLEANPFYKTTDYDDPEFNHEG